jgi:hypothetical protein
MIVIEQCSDFDLEGSWRRFRQYLNSAQPLPEMFLLYFYAIECGLKYLLIQKRNLRVCPKTGKNLLFTHQLDSILQDIAPTAAEIGTMPQELLLQLTTEVRSHNSVSDIHLAWRYGLKIQPQNEQEIIQWLKRVDHIIERRLREL